MLENIWRGLLINYYYLADHALLVFFIVMIFFAAILFKVLGNIRVQQERAYMQILEQQQTTENIRYSLTRINRICQENRDKQHFVSNQLNKIDDSIYELEEQISSLKDSLWQQPFVKYLEPSVYKPEVELKK